MPYIQSLLPVGITFYKIKPHYCINIKEYVLNGRLYRKLNYKIQCIIITNIIKQKEVYISFKYFSGII